MFKNIFFALCLPFEFDTFFLVYQNFKMTLKIFADLLSQPSRALVLFCRAAKIPHEFQAVNLKNFAHKSKAMTRINPLQTVRI